MSGTPSASPVVEARALSRRFAERVALDGVSLTVDGGRIEALLGPNGAGKTTLVRVLTGLVRPDAGEARVLGVDTWECPRELRARMGLVPSGDRSLYLRISGLENLLFFGRLHGMSKREATTRAFEVLELVDLTEAAKLRTAFYSHGMQKRLSIARALLTAPNVLMIDEATHDLDPEAAARIRELVRTLADEGAAVLWATQRIEEIRGFADGVTLLREGRGAFQGTVSQLIAVAAPRRYVLRLRNGRAEERDLEPLLRAAIGARGTIAAADDGDPEDFLLHLEESAVLGEVLASLTAGGVDVLGCREEVSEIENAYLNLAGPGE
ncbi:MAG TPA: ABC transporter ATP-binding protein [Gaiellaceae bacterium]|nr:ABC transporter ATP-binding protein [Gaiellaceae bacterium]